MESIWSTATIGPGVRTALQGRTLLKAGALAWVAVTLSLVAPRLVEAHATDRVGAVLRGTVLGIVVPLATLSLVGLSLRGKRVADAVTWVGVAGGNRRHAAAGLVACLVLLGAAIGGLASLAAVLGTHGNLSAHALNDGLVSARVGAVVGTGYAGMFALGSTVRHPSRGRWVVLVVEWVLGSIPGFPSAIAIRSHACSMAGGAPVLDLSQPTSMVCVLLIGAACAGAACMLVRR